MFSLLSTVTKYDTLAFCWCMSRKRAARFALISRWVSRLGDGYLYALLGVMLLWLEEQNGAQFFYTGLLAFAIELPAYLIFKNSVRRNRPADALIYFQAFLVPSDKFSFPSGHTAAAFVIADMIGFYYPEFSLVAFLLAGMIGCSRVLLGVHFPTDILVGMLLGLASSSLAIKLMSGV